MTVGLLTKSRSPAPVTLAAAALVLQPPRHLDAAPLLLLPGQYHIGSDPDCELVLDAAGIAPQHLKLIVGSQGIRLSALDSRTWVNDFLVKETNLRKGDRISVGPLTITLRAATPDDVLAHVPAPIEPEPVHVPASIPAVLKSIDATLEQVQADLAAVQSIEIAIPDGSDAESEAAQAEVPLSVATPLVNDLAERVAAWERTRAEQESQLAEKAQALDLHAAELAEREAQLTAREAEAAAKVVIVEPPIPEIEHAATPTVDEFAEQVAAWELTKEEQERQLAEKSHDLAVRAAEFAERETRLAALEARLIKREEILDQRQTEFDSQRTAIDYREATLTEERLRLEAVAAQARTELAAEAEKQTAAWEEWDAAQRKLAATLNDQLADLREEETRLAAEKSALEAEQHALAQSRQLWETERGEWDARRRQQEMELAQWEAEAYHHRQDLAEQAAQLETQRADLNAEACQRAAAHHELFEARQDIQRERRLLAEQQSAWMSERESQWNEMRERRRRIDADEREIADLKLAARDELAQLERERAQLAAVPLQPVIEASTSPAPLTVDESPIAAQDTVEPAAPEGEIPATEAMFAESVSSPVIGDVPEVVPDIDATAVSSWDMSSVPAAATDPSVAPWPQNFEAPVIEQAEAAPPPSAVDWEQVWSQSPAYVPTVEPVTDAPEPIAFEAGSLAESLTLALRPSVEPPPIAEAFGTVEAFEDSPLPEATAGETASESDLHVRLAEMFGLPQDFGHRETMGEAAQSTDEITIEEIAADSVSESDVAAEPDVVIDEAPAPTSVLDADEAWRAKLAMMLATPSKEPPPEAISAKTAPVESTPPVKAAAGPVEMEEDSIAAYMERLLARNNMGSSSISFGSSRSLATAVPEPVRTVELPVQAQEPPGDFGEYERSLLKDAALPALENKTRVDKDEVRAALQSFREVANLSARTALAQHSSKTVRGEIIIQGVLTGLAALAAAGYWCGPLFGASMQPLHGTGCLLAAGVMGWQISRSLSRLKNWNPNDVLLAEDIHEDEASITNLLVQAKAALHESAANDLPATVIERTQLPASDEPMVSLQEAPRAEPVSGMIRPGGDLGTADGSQAVAVAAVPVDVQLGGDAILLEPSIEEDRTHG